MLKLTVRFLSMHSFDLEKKESHEEQKRDGVYWTKLFFILFILFYKRYILILLVGSKSLDSVIISDPSQLFKRHKKLPVCRNKADRGIYLHPVQWSLTAEGPLLLRASDWGRGRRGRLQWTCSLSVKLTQTPTVHSMDVLASVCCSPICTL